MPSSVELNGMTINLVENQGVYESMTKNPNELYFVGGEDGGLPAVTSADNGKALTVQNGAWAAGTIITYREV